MKKTENSKAEACMPSINRAEAIRARIRAAYARAAGHADHIAALRAARAEAAYIMEAEKRRRACIAYARRLERELNEAIASGEAEAAAPISAAEAARRSDDLVKKPAEEARARAARAEAAAANAEMRQKEREANAEAARARAEAAEAEAAEAEAREDAKAARRARAAAIEARREAAEEARAAEEDKRSTARFAAKARRAFEQARAIETLTSREAAARLESRWDADRAEAARAASVVIDGEARAAREARAEARAAADALNDEAEAARRLINAEEAAARAAEAAAEVDKAAKEARKAAFTARFAKDVNTYREAREAEAAAADRMFTAIVRGEAREARAAAARIESIEAHNAAVESRRAAAAFDAAALKEQAARAADSAAKSNQTYVIRADDEAREARAAAGESVLHADVIAWQVAFYPLDYRAVLKGIKRREDGAAALMDRALDRVMIHAENVRAVNRAEAIRAALMAMHGDEAAEAGGAEAAAIAAAVQAARAYDAKKPATVKAYDNAAAVLEMTVSVNVAAAVPAAADNDEARAAQVYNAAFSIVQSATRRAYNAAKGSAAKPICYTVSNVGNAKRYTLTKEGLMESRRKNAAVTASRESVLGEMYNVTRRRDALLMDHTLIPDMIHNAAAAILSAAADGMENAEAARLAGYAAVNQLIDGEGMQGRKTPAISLDALIDAGYRPAAPTPEEEAAARRARAAIVALIQYARPLMTERQRKVMQLTVYGGKNGEALTNKRIAAAVDVKSDGTVSEAQRKARAILGGYVLNHPADFTPAIRRAARALCESDEARKAKAAAKEARARAARRAAVDEAHEAARIAAMIAR